MYTNHPNIDQLQMRSSSDSLSLLLKSNNPNSVLYLSFLIHEKSLCPFRNTFSNKSGKAGNAIEDKMGFELYERNLVKEERN